MVLGWDGRSVLHTVGASHIGHGGRSRSWREEDGLMAYWLVHL
jgi:hypothetical protein